MRELNLIEKDHKDLENFLNSIIAIGEENHEIVFETGEYGMLLFHRIVVSMFEASIFTYCSVGTGKADNACTQSVTYSMLGGRKIILQYNPDLDKREGQEIDDTTGFPVRSSTIYLKDITI